MNICAPLSWICEFFIRHTVNEPHWTMANVQSKNRQTCFARIKALSIIASPAYHKIYRNLDSMWMSSRTCDKYIGLQRIQPAFCQVGQCLVLTYNVWSMCYKRKCLKSHSWRHSRDSSHSEQSAMAIKDHHQEQHVHKRHHLNLISPLPLNDVLQRHSYTFIQTYIYTLISKYTDFLVIIHKLNFYYGFMLHTHSLILSLELRSRT